ncbi:hypothetical protein DL765_001868 [Monosporascus sp. GIB2]|nr:hypothetical protein DL765_001868 [Monosporascus sp. GIB2]
MYFLNYVDHAALAQAHLNNLGGDLGVAGNDFNVAVSVLVMGYVLMRVPSKHAACRGFFEAPVYPSALYILAIFYTQVASWVAILHTANIGRLRLFSFSSRVSGVIHELNFTSTVALFLACPPYIFACAVVLRLAWSSGRFHEHTWHITAGFAVAIAGFAAAASTPASNPAGLYAACFVFPAGSFSENSVITGWIATALPQSLEKKAVRGLRIGSTVAEGVGRLLTYVSAWSRGSLPIFFAQIGQIYGPYLWPKSDGPRYLTGFCASATFSLFSLLRCWVMRFMLKRQNRRVQRGMSALGGRRNVCSY